MDWPSLATIAGSLVNGDVLNYPPPTFSPDTGLFYVHEQNTMRISYLMEPDPRGSMVDHFSDRRACVRLGMARRVEPHGSDGRLYFGI